MSWKDKYKLAGECHDANGTFIGRYVFLWHPEQQETFDRFNVSMTKTQEQYKDFFICRDYETTGLSAILNEPVIFSTSWDYDNAVVVMPCNFNLQTFKEVAKKVRVSNQNLPFDLQFDYATTGYMPPVFLDTLTASKLVFSGYLDKFGLDKLVEVFLDNLKITKDTRMDFPNMVKDPYEDDVFTWVGKEGCPSLNDTHIQYAAIDSMLTYRITNKVYSRLVEENLLGVWENIERPLVTYVAKSRYEGLPVDWEFISNSLLSHEEEIVETYKVIADIVQEFPPELKQHLKRGKITGEYNPMAPQQTMRIFDFFGHKLPNSTKDTIEILQGKLVEEQRKDKLLEFTTNYKKFKELSNYVSKFIKPWLTKHPNPKTQRIHPNINIITPGAQTGRLSGSEPNVMAITEDFRPAIIAEEGCILGIRDYSQFEFRAAAGLSGEETMLKSFRDRAELLPQVLELAHKAGQKDPDNMAKLIVKGDLDVDEEVKDIFIKFMCTDIHRQNAASMFQTAPEKVDGSQRSISKAQPLTSKVLTPTGWVFMGSLKIGDEIICPDGSTAPVKGIFPHGDKPCYRLTFDTGQSALACADHLWAVEFRRYDQDRIVQAIVTTSWLLEHAPRTEIRVKLISPYLNETIEVPETSVFGSFESRLEELHSVMCLCGYDLTKKGNIKMAFTHIDVAGYLVNLFRSLGAKVKLKAVNKKNVEYELICSYLPEEVQLNGLAPCNVYNGNDYIVLDSVIFDWVQPVQCIEVDHPEHQYITDDYIRTHNTIGYAVLYGGMANRVQQALLKEGFFYTLEQCEEFVSSFFKKLPDLNVYLAKLRASVLNPGYITTPLGRKKWFKLPPTWRSDYGTKLSDAEREAQNAAQQSPNADALKLSMNELNEIFDKDFVSKERPRVYFPVHDELIVNIIDHLKTEVFDLIGDVMVKNGEMAINYTCPIEVSGILSPHWLK